MFLRFKVLGRQVLLFEFELVDEVPSFLNINVDRSGFGLIDGQVFLCIAEDGSGLGQKLALVNLGGSGDLAHFGHSLDQFPHVGEVHVGGSLLGLHIAHEG